MGCSPSGSTSPERSERCPAGLRCAAATRLTPGLWLARWVDLLMRGGGEMKG